MRFSTAAIVRGALTCIAILATNTAIGRAQTVKKTLSASAVVGGTFSTTAGAVTQNAQQGNPCNPGACFDAITTVRANQRWQLQVTLNQTPATFYVNWIQKPQNTTVLLAAGTYVKIATGTGSTPSMAISSEYNANKTTGKGGAIPTAAQLAAVLSYRVIAAP